MKVSSDTYLTTALDPELRRKAVADAEALKRHAHKFDAIAVRGMSGALFGGILAHMLDKNIIIVRKKGDVDHRDSHSISIVEGHALWGEDRYKTLRYLIVDDFECSGETIRTIKEQIDGKAVFVGTYLYRDRELKWADGPAIDVRYEGEMFARLSVAPGAPTLKSFDETQSFDDIYYRMQAPRTRGLIPDFLVNKVDNKGNSGPPL